MKKITGVLLVCVLLFGAALADTCSICGGDRVCDACKGNGYVLMQAYGSDQQVKIACTAGCANGVCPVCPAPCDVCSSDGLCNTCGGNGYLLMQAYSSDQQVKVVCTGMHCASGACAACAAEPVHVFEDPAIEAAVRAKLNKPTGALSAQDLSSVTSLSLSDTALTSLSDLKMLSGLKKLKLKHCGISDLSALKGMTQLTLLDMPSNQIIDLTPLSGLTNLDTLGLSDNLISDLTPLSGLTKINTLYLYKNRIEDIRPLETLKNLTFLNLRANRIVDTSPLLSLPKLETLDLSENPTTKIVAAPTAKPTAKPTVKPPSAPSIISGMTLASPADYLGMEIQLKESGRRSGYYMYSYGFTPVQKIKKYISDLEKSGKFKITDRYTDDVMDDWLYYDLQYIGSEGSGKLQFEIYNRNGTSSMFAISVYGDLTINESQRSSGSRSSGTVCSCWNGQCGSCGGKGFISGGDDCPSCFGGRCSRCGGDGRI